MHHISLSGKGLLSDNRIGCNRDAFDHAVQDLAFNFLLAAGWEKLQRKVSCSWAAKCWATPLCPPGRASGGPVSCTAWVSTWWNASPKMSSLTLSRSAGFSQLQS